LKRDPDSFDAIQGLAEVDREQGKPEKALQFIQAQITRNSNNPALYLLQGQALLLNKKLAEAEAAFSQCVKMDPQNLAAFVFLGQVQSASGRLADAISSYQHAISIAPNNAQLYTALGSIYEAQGNWQQAEATDQKALALQPDNAPAANNLAYLLLEHSGDVNVALTMARTARRGLPNLSNSADTLGWAYFANGAYSLAAPLLAQAVQQTPANATYHYHLGMAYWKLNDKEKARRELEKSIKLNPQAPTAGKASFALSQMADG
jgi:tetratricopeptide (TPR) repeat protein